MIQRVHDILSPLNIPILYVFRPEISGPDKVGISYHFFSEGYENYGDGNGLEISGSLQIDIFSTVDYTNIVKETRQLLESNKFRLADMRDSDDSFTNIQYYHKILIFNYVEEEVK